MIKNWIVNPKAEDAEDFNTSDITQYTKKSTLENSDNECSISSIVKCENYNENEKNDNESYKVSKANKGQGESVLLDKNGLNAKLLETTARNETNAIETGIFLLIEQVAAVIV